MYQVRGRCGKEGSWDFRPVVLFPVRVAVGFFGERVEVECEPIREGVSDGMDGEQWAGALDFRESVFIGIGREG